MSDASTFKETKGGGNIADRKNRRSTVCAQESDTEEEKRAK